MFLLGMSVIFEINRDIPYQVALSFDEIAVEVLAWLDGRFRDRGFERISKLTRGRQAALDYAQSEIECCGRFVPSRGKLNAVRSAFKAGITPSRIAREFGIPLSDVRQALASGETKR